MSRTSLQKFAEEKVSFWLTKSLAGDFRDLLCKNFSGSMAVDQGKILARPNCGKTGDNYDVLWKSVGDEGVLGCKNMSSTVGCSPTSVNYIGWIVIVDNCKVMYTV